MIVIRFFILIFLNIILVFSLQSQAIPNGTYRLTSEWLGEGKSLSASGNKIKIINSKIDPIQYWNLEFIGNETYRITNQKLGTMKSLDIINDGVNNKLQMAKTNNVTGQLWKITPQTNGFYRLTTEWLGAKKSLDIINDSKKENVQMADSGNYSGQKWKFSLVSSDPNKEETTENDRKNGAFKTFYLSGFKIIVNSKLAEKKETKEAINLLSELLKSNTKVLKPDQLKKLQIVPIWIQYKVASSGLWYHPSREWLTQNGYPKEMERSIEIGNIKIFLESKQDQPFIILHELAHAYSDIYLAKMQGKIKATYQKAKASGKYNSVPYIRGGKLKHYAMNNASEYFAELTEAYFGQNDYYPFNKKDLKNFDPDGFSLMEEAWK